MTETSNDVLERVMDESRTRLNYRVIAQSVDEVQDVHNAPAISMWRFLQSSEQTGNLGRISIYAERGTSREQVRLLYMNDEALRIWESMGKHPTLIGALHRPPKTAMLTYGVPFSE